MSAATQKSIQGRFHFNSKIKPENQSAVLRQCSNRRSIQTVDVEEAATRPGVGHAVHLLFIHSSATSVGRKTRLEIAVVERC